MKVRLLMFGALSATTGVHEQYLELPENATTGAVLRWGAAEYPEAGPILDRVAVAGKPETTGFAPIDEVMELVADPGAGGTVVFVGTVREQSEGWGEVNQLSYSIYREMAETMLRRVAEEAAERWPLTAVCILHRVGDLAVGDQTVIIACSAPHRQEAFEAARYGVD